MSFINWLRTSQSFRQLGTTARKSHRSARSARATCFRPQLETLEARSLLSAFTVTNLFDSGPDSLRAAVAAANANAGPDTIAFATTGTIALTSGQLVITDSLTINGPGTNALTVSGNYASRVIFVGNNSPVLIADLTIANGRAFDSAGGGIYMGGGTLTLDHVTVSGNSSVGSSGYGGDGGYPYAGGSGVGGGIYMGGGTLTLDHVTVSRNSSVGGWGYGGNGARYGFAGGSGVGGGIHVVGGVVYVNQSIVSGNQAVGGQGGDADWNYWAQLGEDSYGGNGGAAAGGGIAVSGGRAEFYQSSISGNSAIGGSGGSGSYPGWGGASVGGGLQIAPGVPPIASLDAYTESNTINNYADTAPNISGPYSLGGSVTGKTWVGPASGGNWSTAANWSPGGAPAAGDAVTIADSAVVLAASSTVGSLSLTGGAALTLATNGNRVLRTSSLTIGGTSKLNLNDNDLILDYAAGAGASPLGSWNGSAYTGVTGMITRGSNFGAWDGSGIVTTRPDALSGLTTLAVAEAADVLFLGPGATALWNGQTVDATTVIVKYTYTGDVDLNGYVDAADYGAIDNWIQFPGTSGYANGDFNFDGVIDAADYGYIDNSIQVQGAPL